MIKKVTFIGSKHLGIGSLNMLYSIAPDKLFSIVTIDDSKDARSKLDEFKEFSNLSKKKLHVLNKPSQLKSVIDEDKPQLCIVVGWYWIIKEDILKMVPKGFLGIHASLLPKHRGCAPLIWPIINGDKESGLTLFYFDKGIDTGDIVAQKKFYIKTNDTIADVMQKVEALIVELLEEYYTLLLNEKAPRIHQNHQEATYGAQRMPEDGRIDWNLTNFKVNNFIRAQTHPYPGAFCFTKKDEKLYIWESKIYPKNYYGTPGLVVQALDNYVVVTCKKGAVCLYKVQLENSEEEIASKVLKYGMRLK